MYHSGGWTSCVLVATILCAAVSGLPATNPNINITISVPEGTSDHGNPNLLCTPTKWLDVLVFFFANYLAHGDCKGISWREYCRPRLCCGSRHRFPLLWCGQGPRGHCATRIVFLARWAILLRRLANSCPSRRSMYRCSQRRMGRPWSKHIKRRYQA
jgi:hypothetical protein